MAFNLDPETMALVSASRHLVGHAYRLINDLGQTVDELERFAPKLEERRQSQTTYRGRERRSE